MFVLISPKGKLCFIAQAALKVSVFPILPPKCCNHRFIPVHLTQVNSFLGNGSLMGVLWMCDLGYYR